MISYLPYHGSCFENYLLELELEGLAKQKGAEIGEEIGEAWRKTYNLESHASKCPLT